MKISADSIKSAGEIVLTFGDEIVIFTGLVQKKERPNYVV